jgi:hypothetical protein
MTTSAGSNDRGVDTGFNTGSRAPWTLVALAVIVWAEVAMLAAWSVWYVTGFVTDVPDSYAGAVLVLALSVLATVWLGFAAAHLLRRKTWTRAAILVWQLCQTAIAAGAFQGIFAAPVVGAVLLVPALAAGVLLFTPSVVEALRRDPRA